MQQINICQYLTRKLLIWMNDSLMFIVVLGNIVYKVKVMNSNSFRIFGLSVTFQTELKKTDIRKLNYLWPEYNSVVIILQFSEDNVFQHDSRRFLSTWNYVLCHSLHKNFGKYVKREYNGLRHLIFEF
jgi:hypothetical protein